MMLQYAGTNSGQFRSLRALLGFLLAVSLITSATAAPFTPRQLAKDSARTADAAFDPHARDLLRQMLQAENRVALAGDQITTIQRNGQSLRSEQHVVRNGAHALRLDYLQPASLVGETIVDNGKLYWHYIPGTNSLEITPSRVQSLRGRVPFVLGEIKRGMLTVQWLGQDTIAGRQCGVVQVTSRDLTQAPSRRFWIDPANGAQLRIDQYDASGRLTSSSYYANVTYSPPLGPDTFRLPSTPKGARIMGSPTASLPGVTLPEAQTQAGFTLLQPTYLPSGFRFQSASTSDFRRRKLVTLRYVNGLNVLSLFETLQGPNARPEVSGHIGRPRPGVYTSAQSGIRVILVGNLGDDEMQKVVSSVR